MMRATLRLALLLAVGVLLSGPGRGDEDLDEVKRQIKIATDKLVADVRAGLADADQVAKKSVREALNTLDGVEVKFVFARVVPAETVNELKDRVKARREFYQAALTRGDTRYDGEERSRILRQRNEDSQKTQSEVREMSNRIQQLYKQGKFVEAAQLSMQKGEKFGQGPSETAVRRMADLRKAHNELREIKDDRDRRYRTLMKQLIVSSLPVTNDIEFPADWREKTKRRQPVKLSKEEETLFKALQTPITEDLKGQPLQGILDAFEKRYGVRFNLDRGALAQLGITEDAPINIKARGTSLRTVLKQMLADVGLTYIIVKGGLTITTPENAARTMVTRTYYVGDIITSFNYTFDPTGMNQAAAVQSLAAIIEMIQGIEPQTWQANQGAGTIVFNPALMSLTIKQSAEMHYMLQGSLR